MQPKSTQQENRLTQHGRDRQTRNNSRGGEGKKTKHEPGTYQQGPAMPPCRGLGASHPQRSATIQTAATSTPPHSTQSSSTLHCTPTPKVTSSVRRATLSQHQNVLVFFMWDLCFVSWSSLQIGAFGRQECNNVELMTHVVVQYTNRWDL